jgi:hypothetical protein
MVQTEHPLAVDLTVEQLAQGWINGASSLWYRYGTSTPKHPLIQASRHTSRASGNICWFSGEPSFVERAVPFVTEGSGCSFSPDNALPANKPDRPRAIAPTITLTLDPPAAPRRCHYPPHISVDAEAPPLKSLTR